MVRCPSIREATPMSRLVRLACVMVLAVTAILLPGVPASAAALEWQAVQSHPWDSPYWENCQQNYLPTAQGCFFSNGDWLAIADIEPDGMRTGIHWATDYGARGVCYQANGADSHRAALLIGEYACKRDMAEGSKVRIQVGRCNDYAGHRCTGNFDYWRDWSGWSPWLTI
jgi:hypothetical protein